MHQFFILEYFFYILCDFGSLYRHALQWNEALSICKCFSAYFGWICERYCLIETAWIRLQPLKRRAHLLFTNTLREILLTLCYHLQFYRIRLLYMCKALKIFVRFAIRILNIFNNPIGELFRPSMNWHCFLSCNTKAVAKKVFCILLKHKTLFKKRLVDQTQMQMGEKKGETDKCGKK